MEGGCEGGVVGGWGLGVECDIELWGILGAVLHRTHTQSGGI